MAEHPNLVYMLLGHLKQHPTMKSKALKILTGEQNATAAGGVNGNISDSGMGTGDFNLPPSPTMGTNPNNISLFSPQGTDSPGMWSSGNEYTGVAQPSSISGHHQFNPHTVCIAFVFRFSSFIAMTEKPDLSLTLAFSFTLSSV
jgi:hypothetical protein